MSTVNNSQDLSKKKLPAQHSPFLSDEQHHSMHPKLARAIGVSAALFLQRLKFRINWKQMNKYKKIEGRHWVYNTYEEWQDDLDYYSLCTIKNIVKKLETIGILLTKEMDPFKKGDRTKWYAIDYDKLNEIYGDTYPEIDEDDEGNQGSNNNNGSNIKSTDDTPSTPVNTPTAKNYQNNCEKLAESYKYTNKTNKENIRSNKDILTEVFLIVYFSNYKIHSFDRSRRSELDEELYDEIVAKSKKLNLSYHVVNMLVKVRGKRMENKSFASKAEFIKWMVNEIDESRLDFTEAYNKGLAYCPKELVQERDAYWGGKLPEHIIDPGKAADLAQAQRIKARELNYEQLN